MEFVNTTAVVAALDVIELEGDPMRRGIIHAKATFSFDAQGKVALEVDDPVPLFKTDEETELGRLPRDDFPALQPVFDVVLLGTAYAPRGRSVSQMKVALAVGPERRELLVTGDRVWVGKGQDARIGRAQPFSSMPLTYERAFGGSADVLIDREAPIEVTDPRNPEGRGLDVASRAEFLATSMQFPQGYPKFDEAPRALPNVEDVNNPIKVWSDDPDPGCWATVPLHSSIHGLRSVDHEKIEDVQNNEAHPLGAFTPSIYQRASNGWTIAPPSEGATIRLEGLLPDVPGLDFNLPRLRVMADVCVGEETGVLPLPARMLVIEPDRMRFFLVYRGVLRMPYLEGQERSARIRVE